MKPRHQLLIVAALAVIIIAALAAGRYLPGLSQVVYQSQAMSTVATTTSVTTTPVSEASVVTPEATTTASHVMAPENIKGIYMTSWVAGTPNLRNALIAKTGSSTGINTVVIDIKDYTGYLSFVPNDPTLKALGAYQNRISDLDSLIAELHSRGLYVIGRIVTFQDPIIAQKHPEWAVQNGQYTKNKAGVRIANSPSVVGAPWKDNAGLMWVDPGASGNWQYLAEIGKEAYDRGFDEVNFDYVRFPSDGDVSDANFPASGNQSPPVVLTGFFQYVSTNLRGYGATATSAGLKTSADLFGMTTTANDDMGIGQVLDDALPYFDYIDPMVYPSHFSAGWDGFAVPDTHPYDVIKLAMTSAATEATQLAAGIVATTTPAGVPRTKSVVASIEAIPLADRQKVTTSELRPWLQDFELHSVPYTAPMITDEIQATTDSGAPGWLMWDPNNKYTSTVSALTGK